VARRIHVPHLHTGDVALEPAQAHHARDVLRLGVGDAVELFDAAGAIADGVIARCTPDHVVVAVAVVRPVVAAACRWTIASAIPKAARGDWMIEKLSELGTSAFIPLITTRSVVVPEGKNKLERWERLATEAARQSRGAGVMRIAPPMPLAKAISITPRGAGWFCSTGAGTTSIANTLAVGIPSELTIFIGPEGGWTEPEIAAFDAAGLPAVSLGSTVLRIETAALAAAAIVAAYHLKTTE
jgi:16S rRNA (uracil1498-N3)-methyltransferase